MEGRNSCTRRLFRTLEEALKDIPKTIHVAKEVALAECGGKGTPQLSNVEVLPPDIARAMFPDQFVVTVRHVIL